MTLTLLVLVAIMATVVWWLFRQTIHVRPWIAQVDEGGDVGYFGPESNLGAG